MSYRDVVSSMLLGVPLTVAVAVVLLLSSADRTARVAPAPSGPKASAPAGRWEIGAPVVWQLDGRLYFYRGPGRPGRCLISETATGPTRQVTAGTLAVPTHD